MATSVAASFIVNNYDYGLFFKQVIDTAQDQLYPNTEVIVVNDCSADDSREIIERVVVFNLRPPPTNPNDGNAKLYLREGAMDYQNFLSNISFRLIGPETSPASDGLYILPRRNGGWARLLQLPEAPFDLINTTLPCGEREMQGRLRDICKIPRMSTFVIGAMINLGVSQMSDDQAFVNVGLWNGFTFLAGMIGNPGKVCIGIDNFSEYGGPRDAFNSRFDRYKSQKHHFYDMDYAEYFSRLDKGLIGFYLYDAEHSYHNQLRGLQIAEPFFADGCIILIDDTNWSEPRNATLDFINASAHDYRMLLDVTTCCNSHPTFWNGIMILQKVGLASKEAPITDFGPPSDQRTATLKASSKKSNGARAETTLPLAVEEGLREFPVVSIIVNSGGQGHVLSETIESALNQTHPRIEVIVVDDGSTDDSREIIARYGTRVIPLLRDNEGHTSAINAGLSLSKGDFVCLVNAGDRLASNAVEVAMNARDDHARFLKNLHRSMREIERLVPAEETFILVDEDQWGTTSEVGAGRHRTPFLERGGEYWGPPPDDATAIQEFERLRKSGASFIVFGWPAFWWFGYYPGFHHHLRSTFRCAMENERVVVFDLRR